MDQKEALELIDEHKNSMTDPVEMLSWVYLRVIISNIDSKAWKDAKVRAYDTLSR